MKKQNELGDRRLKFNFRRGACLYCAVLNFKLCTSVGFQDTFTIHEVLYVFGE